MVGVGTSVGVGAVCFVYDEAEGAVAMSAVFIAFSTHYCHSHIRADYYFIVL